MQATLLEIAQEYNKKKSLNHRYSSAIILS
jgi:hypothetical protein